MKPFSGVCHWVAIFLGCALAAAGAQANPQPTDYVTTLTLQQPGSEGAEVTPFIEQVEFHWTTDVAEGSISAGVLSQFSMRILEAVSEGDCVNRNAVCREIYFDEVIRDGVLQNIGGRALDRAPSEPIWDFDLETNTLIQFRNVLENIEGSPGEQYRVEDNDTLPIDGEVFITRYLEGTSQELTVADLAFQTTTVAPDQKTAVTPVGAGSLSFLANLTHGWQFTPAEDITLTALGWSDPGSNGLASSHEVGLFHINNATPIITRVITNASRLSADYRYEDIPPTRLSAGETYIIAGYDPGGDLRDGYATSPLLNTLIPPEVGYEGYVSASGPTGLSIPTGIPDPEIACCGRWAVNFEFRKGPGLEYGSWGGGNAAPPSSTFNQRGNAAQTTVLADGASGQAIFNYDNNTSTNTGGAAGAWEFSTVASASGSINLDYVYSGFHAFFQVRANLEVFVVRDGVPSYSTLVAAGPNNCCSTPSAGFNYSGTTTVDVRAGDEFGFRMAGTNSDSNSRLSGTLSVNTEGAVIIGSALPDLSLIEDGPGATVDLSQAFDSDGGLTYSFFIDNPSLFGDVALESPQLDLPLSPDQNGVATVTVLAVSDIGTTATDSFSVEVVPVNDAPFPTGVIPDQMLELGGPGTVLELDALFDDVDLDIEGDTQVFSVRQGLASIVGLDGLEGAEAPEGDEVSADVVNLDLQGDLLNIEAASPGETVVGVTVTDSAGESASLFFDVKVTDPEFLGDAVLVQAVTGFDPSTGNSGISVAINATGEPGESTQTVELLTASACTDGTLGEDAVVFAEVVIPFFDANGEAYLTAAFELPAPIGQYATARIRGQFSSGAASDCIVAGPDNDSWIRALDLVLTPSGEVSIAKTNGFLDREGNARWYRFPIQPGARVTVDLSTLPKDYDLFLFKDIGQAFNELEEENDNDVDGLNRLGAEFAPSQFAPSQFAPSLFAPSQFAPDAYAPSQFAPSQFAPSLFAPSQFAPSVFAPSQFAPSQFAPSQFAPSQFAPSQFAPSQFAPSQFAPSQFAPENFVSAQVRSLIGVSAVTGTGSEQVVVDTWNNTGFFYVRVSGKNGAFDLNNSFQLSVELDGVDCTGVVPFTETVSAGANDYRSMILWDSVRVANDPDNTPSEVNALRANLEALAARTEVNGVLLDLAGFANIQASHDQADNFTSCPYAENLTAEAIKAIVDGYREQNPNMAYVVLVGSDSSIPFFRYPDQGLLGPEQDYNPPVSDGTQSQSALRLNYILGQDEYGAANTLSLRDGRFPVPGLAVGRLVETAADMNAVLEAYLATDAGVIDAPTSTLVTGYDFLTDAANEVQFELVAGTGGVRNDTLITAADISPDDPRSWTAEDLRRELLDEGEDIVFLAGHFSANSALAADYKTAALTTELDAATTEFTNAIIFSAGCHSGYNIVNEDIVPGVTQPLDWTQAFARKGATLVAGTGYQYGDTDFVEYGERLYAGFARELRTGTGPVSVGEALVRAKQDYLATTPDIRGLHRKSIIISTVFGLPMLSVDMPGERIFDPADAPTVTPALVTRDPSPGRELGLQVADISYRFEDGFDGAPVEQNVVLTNLEGGTLTATYFEGPDGLVLNPAEPALPLYTRNVSPVGGGLSLRGVGFRSGDWTESVVLPLTGAPATELRGVHTPFTSPVYFPMRLANSNYFDALTGGGTTLLHVTPVQHRSAEIGDIESILRKFSTLGFRLYYSGNTIVYEPSNYQPALAGPPTMSGVNAEIDGSDIVFSVNVVGDPSAGIQEVWVTYTDTSGSSGQWLPLDLEQDLEDSTLWTGRLPGAAGPPYDYVVQAASGTGLVTLDDNFAAFFKIPATSGGTEPPGPPPVPDPTQLLVDAPFTGAYGDEIPVSANLSSEGEPVALANVVFTIGGSGRVGRTDTFGDVTVNLPLSAPPGDYTLTVSYAGNEELEPTDSEQSFIITPTGTSLTFEFGQQSVGVDGINPGVAARLLAGSDQPLLQRTVYFTLEGGPEGLVTVPVITDNTGLARLGTLQVPPGSYSLTARFLGQIPTATGVLELDDPIYEPSEAGTSITLESACPSPVAASAFTANTSSKSSKKGKGKSGKNRRDDDDDDDDDRRLVLDGFCYLTSDVRDPIVVRNGTLVVGRGVTVKGKIDQYGEGSVIVLESAIARQKITERGPGHIVVYGEVKKKIKEQDAGNIEIAESGHVSGNVDETRDGDIVISGSVRGNVKETGDGDLVLTPTGVVQGKATERGNGTLTNDGTIKKSRDDDDDDDEEDDDEDDDD